jgi:hypothetical protein
MKKFEIQIYYSGFCSYIVEAEDEGDAITKGRQMPIIQENIMSSLENWEEADTAEEIDYEVGSMRCYML